MEEIKQKKCMHYNHKTKERCSEYVSRKDPEKSFCSAHRISMIVENSDTMKPKKVISPREEHFIDYTTFRQSLMMP